jgi:hypothetical protein
MDRLDIFSITSLDTLRAAMAEFELTDILTNKAIFGAINDNVMHTLKNKHIDARIALVAYLNDETVMDTPFNDARDAKHGWDGLSTVRDIALTCVVEGFEYGLLHKSSFLGVDDATVHALINDFALSYYAFYDYLEVETMRTTLTHFEPILPTMSVNSIDAPSSL